MVKNSLESWSWNDIFKVYKVLGKQLIDYRGLKARCHIPDTIDVIYPDAENRIIIRFNQDVQRLDDQLGVLDLEIARRNKLIGVMG